MRPRSIRRALDLAHTWLILDFFGDSRRQGDTSSSLTSTIFTQSFIALILAAVLFDSDAQLVSYVAANLTLSTWFVSLASLGDPERQNRRLADRVLVHTAPLPRWILPLARAAHGSFHLVLITTGMAIPPAILSYWVAGECLWAPPLYLVLASLSTGLLAGALATMTQAVTRMAGQMRAALFAGTLKAFALGGGLVGFAVSLQHLDGTADDLPFGRLAVMCWPPYWGARFLADPITALPFGLALIGGLLLVYLLAALVGVRESNSESRRSGNQTWLQRLDLRFCGHRGPLRGATEFTATMLFRSASFRARVLPLFGIPVAMILLAFTQQNGGEDPLLLLGITLQFPAIYTPFLIAFLPHSEYEGSSWLFDTSPHHNLPLAREASLIALSTHVLLPTHLIAALGIALAGIGVTTAISLGLFSWGLSVFVTAFAIRVLEHTPFSLDETEPQDLQFGGIIGFALVLAFCGGAFAKIADGPFGLVTGFAFAAMAWNRLSRHAKAGAVTV